MTPKAFSCHIEALAGGHESLQGEAKGEEEGVGIGEARNSRGSGEGREQEVGVKGDSLDGS